MSNPDNWRQKLQVLARSDRRDLSILDYGCGAGGTVRSLVSAGYDAFGFDVADYVEEPSNRIAIGPPARLPYADAAFDVVVSDQVFEHAMEQERIFAELHRVTGPEAVQLHVIPAKWQLIEPHIHVPLGGLIGTRWWYRLWAELGIRNPFQAGLSAREVADLNAAYFRDHLNYVSTREYRKMWRRTGYICRFVERDYMMASSKRRVRQLARLARIPGVLSLIRTFWVRIVVLYKADTKEGPTGSSPAKNSRAC
jgi:SAM-dependent methyltransferase